jgi:hypothetical protein
MDIALKRGLECLNSPVKACLIGADPVNGSHVIPSVGFSAKCSRLSKKKPPGYNCQPSLSSCDRARPTPMGRIPIGRHIMIGPDQNGGYDKQQEKS